MKSRSSQVADTRQFGLQEPTGTPAATPIAESGEITVVATGLAYPRGFAWDADGVLHVALAGDGKSPPPAPGQGAAPPRPDAPPSVVRIDDGVATPVVHGLPSTADPYGDVQGPVDVAFLGDQLYVLQDATMGVEAVGLDFPNGLYAAEPDGGVRLVSSVTVYVETNPAENLYHVLELGEPFAMVTGDDDDFWVVDANQGLLLRIHADGTLDVIADLSLNHPVPTAIARAPDGGVYVGFLGPGPHLDGEQKVVKVTPDGHVSDYWTGLAMVTGLAVTSDGTLYALDMSTGNTSEPPNIYPNTGRLVRQTGPSSMEDVVTGLNYPISMAFGPDGGLYVSLPAIAADATAGSIIRIEAISSGPIAMPANLLANAAAGTSIDRRA